MRAFACPKCHALVFFENSVCVTCGSALGYVRRDQDFAVIGTVPGLHPCANLDRAGCNWLAEEELCSCCLLTRTRPADDDLGGMAAFARTEAAKRRLILQLDVLALPTTPRSEDPEHGLAFDLLSGTNGPVTTGHDSGVITIDLAEGSDPHREALRVSLDEPYRTLLGHLRHEIGHWYWDALVDRSAALEPFRALFGDERAPYGRALAEHYGTAAPANWQQRHVSAYAAAHPWEDWGETFAHYLHIRDTLQTAAAYGVRVSGPDLAITAARSAPVAADPREGADSFGEIVDTWLPLTYALNAVNRSMGKEDLYPFVLSPVVLDKLRFVHDRVVGAR